MAASQLDKARKSYSYLQKTLSVQISDTDTTLTPNNVTNIPTDTGVSFVVDRVDSSGTKTPTKRELMTGKISGGTLTSLLRGEQGTTAQLHLANAVIEFVNSGEMWNDLIDFMLQDHSNPNGNHKSLTDDSSNEWLERGSVASAVNQVKITNAATGNKPKIEASGDDTNVGLQLFGKGTGKVETDYLPPQTFAAETVFDHVASGGVWSGDSYGVSLAASMTALVCYINGRRISITAVTARAFTASKDTYIDVLDNANGTGTLVYTEVANNAASPALAANSIRIGIIISAANIAAATSVNQGQETMVLPIASSIPYAVTDSLGNLICPRDPNRKILGIRRRITDFNFTTEAEIVGLVCPVIVPTGRKVKVSVVGSHQLSGAAAFNDIKIYDGRFGSSPTLLSLASHWFAAVTQSASINFFVPQTPTTASKTYSTTATAGSGTSTIKGGTTPLYIMVELA